ncbi:MAG: superoxide dismutase family protein, partial [Lutispora sp.]|nr:superoxide dismutase family protein [Lutispora sp.]
MATASAIIKGGPAAPSLTGSVFFSDVTDGVQVCVSVRGLPSYKPAVDGKSPIGPHGFHIHEMGNCSPGNLTEPFPSTGGHWNPDNEPHGNHAGDFPVLFSNNGRALMCFFTDRFKVRDIIGKSIVIHE